MQSEGFRRLVMSVVRAPPGQDLEIRKGRAISECIFDCLVIAATNAMQE
jgi:hypothetical protein